MSCARPGLHVEAQTPDIVLTCAGTSLHSRTACVCEIVRAEGVFKCVYGPECDGAWECLLSHLKVNCMRLDKQLVCQSDKKSGGGGVYSAMVKMTHCSATSTVSGKPQPLIQNL